MRKLSLSIFLFALGSLLFAASANAQSETESFSVNSSYDLYGRKEIQARLVRTDNYLYFYAEALWWDSRSAQEQNDLRIAFFELGSEFQNRIYPTLTSLFGSELKPGIDGEERITVLIHRMGSDAGGYFNPGDAYSRLQSPGSNEREMVYLNSLHVSKPEAKSFLAHEFTHLITLNQKDIVRRVTEETWLNEARAEYAPTLLGYDAAYRGSNLERRVRDFLAKPKVSLTEWLNRTEDYGTVNVFIQYLVDHYGTRILADSLRSSQTGIGSLEETLRQNGFQRGLSQIYEDWAIAVLVNDCGLGARYCYLNKQLEGLRITPTSYFLPKAETVFSTYHTAFPWSANWHRLVGGGQNLTLEFEGSESADFRVPYVLCELAGNCSVGFLVLEDGKEGTVSFSGFDEKYGSLTIIPFFTGKSFAGNGRLDSFAFSWKVTVRNDLETQAQRETELVGQLLARVGELQEQARQLRALLAQLQGQNSPSAGGALSCARFEGNLSFGMRNGEVKCLQEFLLSQGPEIYPEALVTGNFLSFTRQAIIRFQERYASDILAPLELQRGTGYVGQLTRNKINQLLASLVRL